MSDHPELPRVTGEVYTSHQFPLDSCPREEMHRLEDCTVEVASDGAGESKFKTRDFGEGVEIGGGRLSATFYEREGETHFRLTTEGLNKIRVIEQDGDFITLSVAE